MPAILEADIYAPAFGRPLCAKAETAGRLRLLSALHSDLSNGFNEQSFVAIPFAAPLMLVDCRELLHDSAGLWIDGHAGRIAMAMPCRRWIGCAVDFPVNAMRTFWPQMLHSYASTVAHVHGLQVHDFKNRGMNLRQ